MKIKVCKNNLELNYYYYVYLATYSPGWNTGYGINRKRNCVFFWFQIGCMVSTWSWNCSHSWWFFDVRKECRLWIKRSQLLFSKLIPNQHNFHTSISTKYCSLIGLIAIIPCHISVLLLGKQTIFYSQYHMYDDSKLFRSGVRTFDNFVQCFIHLELTKLDSNIFKHKT